MGISYTAITEDMASSSFSTPHKPRASEKKKSCSSQKQHQDRVKSRGPVEPMESEDNSLANTT